MAGKLSILIGLPRSGKSTYARNWVKEYDIYNRVVVNEDNIRLAMTGQRYNEHIDRLVRATYLVMIKSLVFGNNHVLCDDTHTTWNSLRQLLEIDCNAKIIFWPKRPNSLEELDKQKARSIENARATNQEDLIPAIERMTGNLETLVFNGFDRALEMNRTIIAEKKMRVQDK